MTDQEAVLIAAKSGQELAMCEHAFDGLKAAIIEQMVATAFEQIDKRERLYVALKTLGMVRQALQDSVDVGETARSMMTYSESLAKSGLTRP